MTTTSPPFTLQPVVQKYLDEVAPKGAAVTRKSTSTLMKVLRVGAKVFNPNFDTYFTTIGNTIYVPDAFYDKTPASALEVVSHECIHIKQYQTYGLLYYLGYGSTQLLGGLLLLPIIVLLALTSAAWGWWVGALLAILGMLAPVPAPFRYWFEKRAYRTSLLMGQYVYGLGEGSLDATREWIAEQLSARWYYWCWPFHDSIMTDLRDSSYHSEPDYAQIIKFYQDNLLPH